MANVSPALPTDHYEPPRGSWYKRNQIAITPWLFLLPGMAFFGLYVIWPIAQSFNISLYEWSGLGSLRENGEFVGLSNYRDILGIGPDETMDRDFKISMSNNVKWLVFYLLSIPMGLALALFLNQTVTGIRLYKSLFFFPFVLSQVIVGLVFTWFYLPRDGLLDSALTSIGLDGLNVLGDPDLATYGIIAAGLWPQTAYCMILYLTGLNAVDPEQIEAARLDGAKGWRMLWYVVIPQLKPATFIAFVVTVIGALRSFDLVAIMTNGGPFGQTNILSFWVWEISLGEGGLKYGYASAIAVILFAIMLLFITYFIFQMWRDERAARR